MPLSLAAFDALPFKVHDARSQEHLLRWARSMFGMARDNESCLVVVAADVYLFPKDKGRTCIVLVVTVGNALFRTSVAARERLDRYKSYQQAKDLRGMGLA